MKTVKKTQKNISIHANRVVLNRDLSNRWYYLVHIRESIFYFRCSWWRIASENLFFFETFESLSSFNSKKAHFTSVILQTVQLSVQQPLINKPLKGNGPAISPNLGLTLQTKTHRLFKWYLMHRALVQAVRDFYKRMMGRITGDRRRIRGTKYKAEWQGQSERERGAKWGGVSPGLVH